MECGVQKHRRTIRTANLAMNDLLAIPSPPVACKTDGYAITQ